MPSPPLDPDVAEAASADAALTAYDQRQLVTYLRLLDAEEENADWQEVAWIVLHIEPIQQPDPGRRTLDTHLARPKWLKSSGDRDLMPMQD